MSTINKPLEGITVLEFSQFLSGPAAGLRLSDLGANVIKIKTWKWRLMQNIIFKSDTDLGGDSTLFHAINRNKKSFAANLKDPNDLEKIKKLISKSDVITQNFRPGVIERIGLDYESVKEILKLFMEVLVVMEIKDLGKIYQAKIYWRNQDQD